MQAALKALSNNSVNSETVQRTIPELSQLGYDIPRLTLAWIRAHVGYEGNKLADTPAKQGALEPEMGIKIDISISRTEITNKLKELIYNKWMLRWTTSTDYKHSKKLLAKPNPNLAKKSYNCQD